MVFDGYNISFRVSVAGGNSGYIAFSSVYGRTNMSEYETLLDNAGINYSYTDPNAGSFMSYLVPLIGIVLVCVLAVAALGAIYFLFRPAGKKKSK